MNQYILSMVLTYTISWFLFPDSSNHAENPIARKHTLFLARIRVVAGNPKDVRHGAWWFYPGTHYFCLQLLFLEWLAVR